MIRRPRRNALARIPTVARKHPRARDQAGLTLADARAETGIALQGFDIPMTQSNRVLELVQRYVLAATDEDFHAYWLGAISPQMPANGPCA